MAIEAVAQAFPAELRAQVEVAIGEVGAEHTAAEQAALQALLPHMQANIRRSPC